MYKRQEYAPLVERLHGQVIKISPTSTNYINPMDLNLDYSDEDVYKRQPLCGTGQSESVSVCGPFWGLTQTITPMKR